jgi:hypothetical protein
VFAGLQPAETVKMCARVFIRVLGHWVRRTVTYKLVWTLFAGGLWANWHCTEHRKRIHHKQKKVMEIKHKRIEDGEGIPRLAQTMIIPRTDLLVFSFVYFGCRRRPHTHTHKKKNRNSFLLFLSSLVWRVFLCAAIRTTTTTSSCCCCSLSRLFFLVVSSPQQWRLPNIYCVRAVR